MFKVAYAGLLGLFQLLWPEESSPQPTLSPPQGFLWAMSSTNGPWPSAACTASVGRKLLADPNTLALLPTRRQCAGPRPGLDSRLKGQVSTAFAILKRAGSSYAQESTSSRSHCFPSIPGRSRGRAEPPLSTASNPRTKVPEELSTSHGPPLSHKPLPTGSLAAMALFLGGVFSVMQCCF